MKEIQKIVRRENRLTRFFKWIGKSVSHLFEPEEVEVTFKQEGNKISYTYTKVAQKQVA